MRAMLAIMVALPSIAPASTLTIVHQSIPIDLKQRSKLIASTLDASANQTGFEIVHQSIPVDLEPRSRLNTQSCEKKCDMTLKPVCDSYGETHGNKCAFEIAACKAKKKKLKIVEEGVCGGCRRYEYKLFSELKNFEQARAHCKSQGMDLVMEKTQKIYDDVQKLYGNQQFWVGVIRNPRWRLHFYFVDKSPIRKSHWNPGEPSNRGDARPSIHAEKEDCVEHSFLQTHYMKWNDDRCSLRKKFVCQKCSAHICESGSVCQNGGTCIKMMNQFRCSCKDGFMGKLCEVKCPPGRAGKSCEHVWTWREDRRCGIGLDWVGKAIEFPYKGKTGECNPDGLACCSSSNWCENTAWKYCDCDHCINYKRVPCSARWGKWLRTHLSTSGKKLKIQGGKWQKKKSCSHSSAVRGYRVKIDNRDEDNEGLTELNLYCIAKQNPAGKSTRMMIRSNHHYDGSFSDVTWCPKDEFVVGFGQQLYQGKSDLGVIDVQILCANPKAKTDYNNTRRSGIRYVNGATTKLSHHPTFPYSPGTWTREVTCDPCQVVCGVRTRADLRNWWFYDDAGVTDIYLKCCPF